MIDGGWKYNCAPLFKNPPSLYLSFNKNDLYTSTCTERYVALALPRQQPSGFPVLSLFFSFFTLFLHLFLWMFQNVAGTIDFEPTVHCSKPDKPLNTFSHNVKLHLLKLPPKCGLAKPFYNKRYLIFTGKLPTDGNKMHFITITNNNVTSYLLQSLPLQNCEFQFSPKHIKSYSSSNNDFSSV